MITKNIVWFFGPSCAGKATSISKIIDGEKGFYTQILDLDPLCKVIRCEESIDKSNPRDKLASIILNKYNNSSIDVLLVKGQTKDLEMEIPKNVRSQLHEVGHKIVFLWATPEELNRRRLETRHTDYWNGWDIGNHVYELKLQVQKVSNLVEENFPVIWVDNTDNQPKELVYIEVKLRIEQLDQTS